MFTVRQGDKVDFPIIKRFIEQSEAAYDEGSVFILVENEKKEILCVVGLQVKEQIGFLRSFVFSPAFPAEKLSVFFEKVLSVAGEGGCRSLFLASNKRQTITFFEAFGFMEIDQDNLPEKLKLSTAYQTISCQNNVFFMWKTV